MKSIKFTETITIYSDVERVFDYTQDYSRRLSWDTFLIKAELMQGATEAGVGVKAYCVAKNGLGMITEYVSFQRPKATAIKMTKGPLMFKSFLGSWRFKEVQKDHTEVSFLYSFQLRFPVNLVAKWLRKNLQANVRQRLMDLKKNVEQLRGDS